MHMRMHTASNCFHIWEQSNYLGHIKELSSVLSTTTYVAGKVKGVSLSCNYVTTHVSECMQVCIII